MRGKEVQSTETDVSSGCIIYEMFTGRLAFRGETDSDIIAKILEREPDWSALPAATPAADSTALASLPGQGSEATPQRCR